MRMKKDRRHWTNIRRKLEKEQQKNICRCQSTCAIPILFEHLKSYMLKDEWKSRPDDDVRTISSSLIVSSGDDKNPQPAGCNNTLCLSFDIDLFNALKHGQRKYSLIP